MLVKRVEGWLTGLANVLAGSVGFIRACQSSVHRLVRGKYIARHYYFRKCINKIQLLKKTSSILICCQYNGNIGRQIVHFVFVCIRVQR